MTPLETPLKERQQNEFTPRPTPLQTSVVEIPDFSTLGRTIELEVPIPETNDPFARISTQIAQLEPNQAITLVAEYPSKRTSRPERIQPKVRILDPEDPDPELPFVGKVIHIEATENGLQYREVSTSKLRAANPENPTEGIATALTEARLHLLDSQNPIKLGSAEISTTQTLDASTQQLIWSQEYSTTKAYAAELYDHVTAQIENRLGRTASLAEMRRSLSASLNCIAEHAHLGPSVVEELRKSLMARANFQYNERAAFEVEGNEVLQRLCTSIKRAYYGPKSAINTPRFVSAMVRGIYDRYQRLMGGNRITALAAINNLAYQINTDPQEWLRWTSDAMGSALFMSERRGGHPTSMNLIPGLSDNSRDELSHNFAGGDGKTQHAILKRVYTEARQVADTTFSRIGYALADFAEMNPFERRSPRCNILYRPIREVCKEIEKRPYAVQNIRVDDIPDEEEIPLEVLEPLAAVSVQQDTIGKSQDIVASLPEAITPGDVIFQTTHARLIPKEKKRGLFRGLVHEAGRTWNHLKEMWQTADGRRTIILCICGIVLTLGGSALFLANQARTFHNNQATHNLGLSISSQPPNQPIFDAQPFIAARIERTPVVSHSQIEEMPTVTSTSQIHVEATPSPRMQEIPGIDPEVISIITQHIISSRDTFFFEEEMKPRTLSQLPEIERQTVILAELKQLEDQLGPQNINPITIDLIYRGAVLKEYAVTNQQGQEVSLQLLTYPDTDMPRLQMDTDLSPVTDFRPSPGTTITERGTIVPVPQIGSTCYISTMTAAQELAQLSSGQTTIFAIDPLMLAAEELGISREDIMTKQRAMLGGNISVAQAAPNDLTKMATLVTALNDTAQDKEVKREFIKVLKALGYEMNVPLGLPQYNQNTHQVELTSSALIAASRFDKDPEVIIEKEGRRIYVNGPSRKLNQLYEIWFSNLLQANQGRAAVTARLTVNEGIGHQILILGITEDTVTFTDGRTMFGVNPSTWWDETSLDPQTGTYTMSTSKFRELVNSVEVITYKKN